MSRVLILNSMKAFAHSAGHLNTTLAETAEQYLLGKGHEVNVTVIDKGYDIEQEVAKYEWADIIIYQMPAWWMGEPWIMKKYMDEVFTQGHGRLYASDGRTRSDDHKKYGSGGLLQGKKYLLSVTWNAPAEAFDDPEQFFEGKGVDMVYFHFHKANQFLGLAPLPTFLCSDVMKNPNVAQDIERYQAHLARVI
ncbi:putative NADPH-quinone reductase [Orbus hercynius]|uniref:Putative NADPH-quinone reductase n=1 Tax=Orbus hercynius TaxID=593135 RepID=A0A495RBN5_9GAMM|nr:NAD(P)H-dependent oxidoreductase [Orbus hercynius]RKS84809.1 putative NADPH-quinone reductase [Orbus hercynius]